MLSKHSFALKHGTALLLISPTHISCSVTITVSEPPHVCFFFVCLFKKRCSFVPGRHNHTPVNFSFFTYFENTSKCQCLTPFTAKLSFFFFFLPPVVCSLSKLHSSLATGSTMGEKTRKTPWHFLLLTPMVQLIPFLTYLNKLVLWKT